MTETESGSPRKPGLSKGMIGLIIGIIIVVIGGVIYFSMSGGSLKQQYFLAEGKTLEEMNDYIEDRYDAELDWLEVTQEKPTKSSLDISAEFNDPNNAMMGGMFDVGEVVNNSTIQILTESDAPNKQLNATLNTDVAGISLKDFKVYLTEDTLTMDLPFLNEELMIRDEAIAPLLNEIEPGSMPEGSEINFADLFEAQSQGISEEDLDYLKKEYGMLIYKEIPDSAFESESEKTEVNGEELEAEKISMHLTEEEVHAILTKVFDKLEKDERVKEMLETQYNTIALQDQGLTTEEMLTDFESDINEMKESIPELKMPEGLTSNIWVKDNVVVSREFITQLGEEANLVTLEITGNQIIDKKESTLNYQMAIGSENDSVELNLVGLLNEEDEGYKDDISLNVTSDSDATDLQLSYLSEDEKSDGDKVDFDRTFMLSESGMEIGALHWDGQANYEKDQMQSNHSFAIEAEGLARDLFILNLDITGEQVKEIAVADPETGKDLGEMSGQEVIEYFETDVTDQFTQWLMTQMQQFQ